MSEAPTAAETATMILAFAKQLDGETATQSEFEIARARNWLDADGNPTAEGEALIEALDEQDKTRSVFRTVL